MAPGVLYGDEQCSAIGAPADDLFVEGELWDRLTSASGNDSGGGFRLFRSFDSFASFLTLLRPARAAVAKVRDCGLQAVTVWWYELNGANGQCRMSSKREGGLLEEALTHSVIGAFCDVHRGLGFGFREYLYALALERDGPPASFRS
jgi:hypothetical protein